MSSSSSVAISYPTYKGLSNSSFVQIATKKNSLLNNENTNSAMDTKLKLNREMCSKVKELSKNVNSEMTLEPIEESQQVRNSKNVEHVPTNKNDLIQPRPHETDIESPIKTIQTVAVNPSIIETNLRPSEYFRSLKSKIPNQTYIINNTFISPMIEQDEFVTKLRKSLYTDSMVASYGSNIQSICNAFPSPNTIELVEEHNVKRLAKTQYGEVGKKENHIEDSQMIIAEQMDDIDATISQSSRPLASIIVGILWIALITFWFLLYFKVLKVYKAKPKVIQNHDRTNYEMCLVVIQRIRAIISDFWNF